MSIVFEFVLQLMDSGNEYWEYRKFMRYFQEPAQFTEASLLFLIQDCDFKSFVRYYSIRWFM